MKTIISSFFLLSLTTHILFASEVLNEALGTYKGKVHNLFGATTKECELTLSKTQSDDNYPEYLNINLDSEKKHLSDMQDIAEINFKKNRLQYRADQIDAFPFQGHTVTKVNISFNDEFLPEKASLSESHFFLGVLTDHEALSCGDFFKVER